MTEKTIAMKPFDKRIARSNYHIEIIFDKNSKLDMRERMMRVIRQSIEDDFQKDNMLS